MKHPAQILFILSFFFFLGCTKKNTVQSIKVSQANDSIINVIRAISIQHPDSAILLSRKYQHKTLSNDDSAFYYNLEHQIGENLFYLGQVDSAFYHLEKTQQFWMNKSSEIAKEHLCNESYNLGYLYSETKDYDKGLSYLEQAKRIAKDNHFHKSLIACYLEELRIWSSKEDFPHALEAIENCIYLCDSIKDTTLIIASRQAYADLYCNCYFFEEANQQFEEVLKYKEKFTPYSSYCYHNGKGRMYYLWEKHALAKTEFKKALEFTSASEIIPFLIVNSNLAETSLNTGELKDAKTYLDTLDTYHHILVQLPLFLFNYKSLSAGYYTKTNQKEIAGKLMREADLLAEQNAFDKILYKLHLSRKVNYYESIGKYDLAFHTLKQFNELNKSILEENNRKQVSSLKYQFSRDTTIINQQNQLQQHHQEITSYKKERFLLLVILFVILLLVFIGYLYFRNKRELAEAESLQKISALRIQNTRNTMSPHFFFNLLASFNQFCATPELLKSKLNNLSILLRKVVENIDQTSVTLEKELEAVKAYIDLQQGIVSSSLLAKYTIENNVDLTCNVPSMILQIPVENAIKHGLLPLKGEKQLSIRITANADLHMIEIEDNGIGLEAARGHSTGTGSGLKVLQQTIHILNTKNKQHIQFSMNEKTQTETSVSGTIVTIVLPKNFVYTL